MEGKYISKDQVLRESTGWAELGWMSSPHTTDAKQIVAIEVCLEPGNGHTFHKHPRQEEVLYVMEGEIEQWIGQEKRIVKAGGSAFIPPNIVHATFNVSSQSAKFLAILGPAIGEEGYETVDVFEEEPWASLK